MRKETAENRRRRLPGFLLCLVFLFGGAPAAADVLGQDGNLADGDPPLTRAMVGRYAGLLEWSLDVRFGADDRAALEKQLVKYWQARDEKSIKGVLDTLAFEKNLQGAGEAKRRELRPQIKQKLIETMEAESSDPLNALLLGIYRRQENAAATAAAREENSADEGGTPANLAGLVGRWQVLHGNSVYSADPVSGRIGDGNAMVAQYDVRADGRVIFSFVLQQSNYGCTTRIKTSKTGRAAASGSRVTFSYDGGTTASEDSCNAKNNYTKRLAPEKEILEFRMTVKDGKEAFCFENGKLKDCAVRVK